MPSMSTLATATKPRPNVALTNLTRAEAAALVRDLFKEVGMRVLRVHRAFEQVTFYNVDGLPAMDLCDAICVGLDVLATDQQAIDQMDEIHQFKCTGVLGHLRKRVTAALGDPHQAVTFRVDGHTAVWNPPALAG